MSLDSDRIEQLERRIERLEHAVQLLGRGVSLDFKFDEEPVGGLGGAATFGAGQPDAQVLDLIRFGRKIEAVKAYRELTGVGLKEAKEHVEDLQERIKRGEL